MNATALRAFPVPAASARCGVFDKVWCSITLLPAKETIAAAAIIMMASAVHAAKRIQDRMPDKLSFSEDCEVITDRAIGSNLRMLSITTNTDVTEIF